MESRSEIVGKKITKLADGLSLHIATGIGTVVVKELVLSSSEGILSDTLREVSFNNSLVHPNISRAICNGVFPKQNGITIVMEDLGNPLSKTGLGIEPYIYGLLEAIKYLHDQKIIHRDIKPSNILIKNGNLTLIDLGIARKKNYISKKWTGSIDHSYYSSPEILEGRQYDEKTDLWSLGVVWAESILEEKLPNIHKNKRQVIESIDFIDSTKSIIIGELLNSDPKKRPSIDQLLTHWDVVFSLPTKGYNWSQNSCYLDSLMITLYFMESKYWINTILTSTGYAYQGPNPADLKGGSKITDTKLKPQINKVVDAIRGDLKLLRNQKSCTSMGLRTLLWEMLPSLNPGSWVSHDVVPVYSLLGDLFPNLKIKIPVQIMRWKGKYIPDTIEIKEESLLTFWDYLDPLDNISPGENYKIIRWDLIQSPILVFANGGTPRIKKMNTLENEGGINKARTFGPIILDRYQLFGVVVLQGNVEAGHYVTYFYKNNHWWFYDDMSGEIKRRELPEVGVWVEYQGQMPAMYFYSRIKKLDHHYSKIPEKKTILKRCETVEKMLIFCHKYGFSYDTWFLGVKLLDLWILGDNLSPILLSGFAALSLASKFYETRIRTLDRYVEFCQGFSKDQIRDQEFDLFKWFNYNINLDTVYNRLDGDLETLVLLIRSDLAYLYSEADLLRWAKEGIPKELDLSDYKNLNIRL